MNKIKLLLCLLLAVVMTATAEAQISMTLQVPPMGVLVKNQLWNMLLVNTGNYSVLLRVNLVLLDQRTNQPVLTATTIPFLLGKGAKQLQAKDLSPIQYTYNGPATNGDRDPNGLLPAGAYQACYTVLSATKGSAPLVENCIQVNVDPLSPLLLNTPSDEGRLYTPWPQFTWLPPTPLGLFNDLSYDLIVVEVLPGQGKGDAIEQNIPVDNAGFVRNLYINYPSSYRALDTAHTYAWRVVALNNGLPATMSDIWTFRVVVPPKPAVPQQSDVYVALRQGLDASVASCGDVLKLSYMNAAADTALPYTIISLQERGNPLVQSGSLSLRYGSNLLQVPLQKGAGFAGHKLYLFRLLNGRNETWTMKFTTIK